MGKMGKQRQGRKWGKEEIREKEENGKKGETEKRKKLGKMGNNRNQSPKGKMWSAVPLPCSDIFMSQPLK